MGCGCGFLCGEYEEEEEQFFDTREDLSSASGSCPGSPMSHVPYPGDNFINWGSYDKLYGDWFRQPESIKERRKNFRKCMGLSSSSSSEQSSDDFNAEIPREDEIAADIDRLTADSGAVLMTSNSESHMPSLSTEPKDRLGDTTSTTNVSADCVAVRTSSETVTSKEPKRSLSQSPPLSQNFSRGRGTKLATSNGSEDNGARKARLGWLKKVGIAACIVSRQEVDVHMAPSPTNSCTSRKAQLVKVRSYRKRSKEFSAIYKGQDIKAHEGAIWTMKFSPNGEYLASGGEDGIVRVWHVSEIEVGDEEPQDNDPSCTYFMANHKLELNSVYMNREKKSKLMDRRKTSDAACVVVPPEVFRISEKPLHEFYGHAGAVLDLSWSKDKYLLSSSVDKTVRLWKVGCDDCIKVFSHKDYVTSVQFDPIEEKHFISGSIDGKIRIWDISGCRVVDWADIKDIVTAVCYRPDGKAVVVGSMSGICHFYGLSDNHLQLDTRIPLPGKKKFPSKRITGFQFSPADPQRLMVTSADSQILIFHRFEVVSKYKGLQNAGGIISASFTSDGRYITSASEDSSVYVWNHTSQNASISKKVKSTWSSERFFSSNASVAIPWNGVGSRNSIPISSKYFSSQAADINQKTRSAENCLRCISDLIGSRTIFLSASGNLTLSQGFFSEFLPKGSATWPEEKLSLYLGISAQQPVSSKSKHKLAKNSCQDSMACPNAWGQVIVTAGLDGRIRSFCNYGLPIEV